MNTGAPSAVQRAMDTVEVARMEMLLRDQTPEQLETFFTAQELADAGVGPGRVASLAACFAAKEACCKLFPRETTLGSLQLSDFSVRRDTFGAAQVDTTAAARAVLDRRRVGNIKVSLTHTQDAASAVAWAESNPIEVPWFGRWLYHLFPYRRLVVMGNLRRVYGDVLPETELRRLAQAYCGHFVKFLFEFMRLPLMSGARRRAWIRVDNIESPVRAHQQGKGILLLTGHFGNFEVATVAGIGQFPQYRGLFHFVRRPLNPKCLNDFATWRFRRAGFGTLAQRGSLDAIFDVLSQGGIIVYPFDQHASRKDGVTVDFFGHPAGTHKSVALLALSTGAPVIPASSWREPDGSHVLRFEDPLPLIECDNVGEAIRRNTRAYNEALERMLLRHPEQWIWMHRRWKV
jgi:KDO2-lipid IV(A) lauroyltransferase